MRSIPDNPTVVALGGAGGMGRVAVEVAAGWGDIGELIVADRDLQRAEAVAEATTAAGSTRVRAAAVDVTGPDALAAALRDADVVLNTTGPFYKLGVPVLAAAIEAGCHYLDICDDWEPTIDLLAMNDRAVDAGVAEVIGMGASPGASNLLAALAAEDLDVVEDVYTAWPVDVATDGVALQADTGNDRGEPTAAVVHWMQQLSGTIRVVEDGSLVDGVPLEARTIDFPGGGSGTTYTVGHPEPITLADHLQITGRSATLMVVSEVTVAFLATLRDDIDAGDLTIEEAGNELMDFDPARLERAVATATTFAGPGDLPAFFAVVTGTRSGTPLAVGARALALPPTMADATGVPLALGLRQLLDGTITHAGVHPPERVIDPRAFFDGLAPHCVPLKTGMDDAIQITEHAG